MDAADNSKIVYHTKLFGKIGELLFLDKETADFFFTFKLNDDETKQLPVHKCILIAGSQTFEELFDETWKNKREETITDCSFEAFEVLLRFFYFSEVELETKNVADILKLGLKYQVAECLNACAKCLKNTLNAENVIWGYELAISTKNASFKKFCEIMIAAHTTDVLNSACFLDCKPDLLRRILDIDAFSCPEAEVFEACMKWTKRVSGEDNLTRKIVDTHLGDLFYAIRIRSITNIELAVLIPTYGSLFSAEEYQEIILMSARDAFEPKNFTAKYRYRFGTKPFEGEMMISSNRVIPNVINKVPYFLKDVESITFTTNETFLLGGFQCTPLSSIAGEFISSNVTIREFPPGDAVESKIIGVLRLAKLYAAGSFAKMSPVFIRPGFRYEIQFEQTLPHRVSTLIQLKPVLQMTSDIVVTFHNDHKADDGTHAVNSLVCGFFFDPLF